MEFSKVIPKEIKDEDIHHFIELEALLAVFYNNREITNINLLKKDENGIESTTVNSILDKSKGEIVFVECLKSIVDNWDIRKIKLEFLIDKIDLIEAIKI